MLIVIHILRNYWEDKQGPFYALLSKQGLVDNLHLKMSFHSYSMKLIFTWKVLHQALFVTWHRATGKWPVSIHFWLHTKSCTSFFSSWRMVTAPGFFYAGLQRKQCNTIHETPYPPPPPPPSFFSSWRMVTAPGFFYVGLQRKQCNTKHETPYPPPPPPPQIKHTHLLSIFIPEQHNGLKNEEGRQEFQGRWGSQMPWLLR